MKPSALIPLCALLAFAPPPAVAAGPTAIITSPLDAKQYRVLTLDNGLKVALVSDPASDKAAASLDVHIGAGNDPENWQGLAHFLEHMLFLGNEKYPEVGEYTNFISDHGGHTNAYTSFAHTNYFFNVSAEHLLPALDRFAQFFIAPTFDATFVNRERAVVHSEYQARLKDEGRRLWSARRQLLSRAHPASRFMVGSEHTLRDRDGVSVRQQLIEFYNRHYSANLMALAVVGREPLAQLESWTRELFAAIPNRGGEVARFDAPYINPAHAASRLNARPQKDELRLQFTFPVASYEADYRSKPLGYVANLLGHEGEGSLLALLKTLGWAEGLSAGGGYMDKVQGTFEVSIELTEPGLEHIDDIGELLFQTINLIADEGVAEWRFEEGRKLAALGFRFAEEREASATARTLANGLQRYPVEDALRGPYRMDDYRPELLREVLARLTPDNASVQVVSKDAETDAKTPFYDVDFGIQPLAPATLKRWRQAGHAPPDPRLALPSPNRFIPDRLSVHADEQTASIPQRLADEAAAGMNAWYQFDAQFGTPRAVFYFSVESPRAGDSARNLALTQLFINLVNQRLEQPGYPALLAGLHYDLYRHSTGFSARLSGYADKQPVLLAVVLEALFVPRFDADKLALAVAELKRKWNNSALEPPYQQGARELYRLLLEPEWSEQERLAVIDSITLADLTAHAAKLLGEVAITTLAHGDLTRARAVEMNRRLGAAFAAAARVVEVAPVRVRRLDDRPHLRSMDVEHGDSALLVYYQGREKSDAERARMLLLAQLLEAPFFFNLRTTHRVGYLVRASAMNILQVPGLLLAVQSPSHSPAQINALFDAFVDEFRATLQQMDEPTFAQIKQGLRARILTRDQKLSDRSNRYWREIDRKQFEFDSRARLVESLDRLSRDDMRVYLRQLIQERPRKLTVQSPGKRQHDAAQPLLGGDEYARIDNAQQFRGRATRLFPAE